MKHIVSLIVSQPGHEFVSMRSRTQQKTYMQEARSVDEAINRATRHFRTLGFKVHTATVQEQKAPEAPKQNLTEGFMGSPYSNAYKEAKKVIDPKYHDTLLGALKSMADGKDEAETFNKIDLGSGHKDAKKILTKHGIDTVLEEDVQDTQAKINAAKAKREAAMEKATAEVDKSDVSQRAGKAQAGSALAAYLKKKAELDRRRVYEEAGQGVHPAVIAFASKAHDEWRKGFDPEGTGKERVKKNSDGTEGNINVPFNKLHPDWQRENLAAGHAAKEAVEKHGNDMEAAAEHIHNEWMKRNPKGDWNAAQHVPYKDLPEDEKEKDRVHVRTMQGLLRSPQNEQTALEKYLARKAMMSEQAEVEQIQEELKVSDGAAAWIEDFVKSDNPKFEGKSKRERIQMALGAFYAEKRAVKEEVEQIDEGYDKSSTHHQNARKMARLHDGKATYNEDGTAKVTFHRMSAQTGGGVPTDLMSAKEVAKLARKDYGSGNLKGHEVYFAEEVDLEVASQEAKMKAAKEVRKEYGPGDISYYISPIDGSHIIHHEDKYGNTNVAPFHPASGKLLPEEVELEEASELHYGAMYDFLKNNAKGVLFDTYPMGEKETSAQHKQRVVNDSDFRKNKSFKDLLPEEAEGTTPKTPKEKELAAKAGDPTKITKKDVLAARGVKLDEGRPFDVKAKYSGVAGDRGDSKGGDITVPQSQKDEIAKIFAKKDDKKETKDTKSAKAAKTILNLGNLVKSKKNKVNLDPKIDHSKG